MFDNSLIAIGWKAVFERAGYRFFEDGAWNLNIFGVRNTLETQDRFDDFLNILCKDDLRVWRFYSWPITTQPGGSPMSSPPNTKGVAILVPGQYRGVYKIDIHNGSSANAHEALCQRLGEVAVYRDNNLDGNYDYQEDTIESGMFGINIHRSRVNPFGVSVGGWSAGCQVFRNEADFRSFMDLVRKSSATYGNSFTYTLFAQNRLEAYVEEAGRKLGLVPGKRRRS